ncbi:MAG: hypothetical protein ABIL49_07890 [candidate division WOR-3 bacterium]|jgi:hypothetical protein
MIIAIMLEKINNSRLFSILNAIEERIDSKNPANNFENDKKSDKIIDRIPSQNIT